MSAISTILARLRAAIWAIDVRDDIANAIEQCYSDVSNPTLKTEALEAALQNKIDQGEMAALTIGDHTITAAKLANGVIPAADATLTETGKPADAAETGRQIGLIKADLDALEPGLTDTAKGALMACFKNVAWKDATVGETMYNALAVALDYSEDALPSGYTEKGYIYRTQAESDWTDGLSKLLKTPSYTNVTDLTYEYDVMPITATGGNKMIVAASDYSKIGGTPSMRGAVIFYIDTTRSRISVFSHATAIGVNDISTVATGKKTHVKLVPGTESPAKLYLNGSLAAEGAWTSTEKGTARIGLNTYIGNGGADRTKASDNVAVGILSLYDSNNNPVARYVPCIRNADNVIGWYDTVSRTFITTDTVSYATIGHQNCIYAVGDWEE